MKRNTQKLLLDFIMIILFLIMYKKRIISIGFHEIIGLLVFLFVLIHLFYNRKLIIKVSKKFKQVKTKTKSRYIVDIILLIVFIMIIITGIMISKVLFNFNYFGIWKFVHNFLCGLALILIGIHCGLEWDVLINMCKKLVKIPKKISKPLGIIFTILILICGLCSIVSSPFGEWISGPFTYDASNHHNDGHGTGDGIGLGNNKTAQGNGFGQGQNNNLTNYQVNDTSQRLHKNSGSGLGNDTSQRLHKNSGSGLGNDSSQRLHKNSGGGLGNDSSQRLHKNSGSGSNGLHKNSGNGQGIGLGNNGTAQHKNHNTTNESSLINFQNLQFNNIFNGNIDYLNMLITIVQIGSIIGFFAIITRYLELFIKR